MILSKFTQKQTRSLSRAAICFAMAVCLSVPIFSASAQIQIPNIPGVNEAIVNSFSAFKHTYIDWAEEDPQARVIKFNLTSINRDGVVHYSSGNLHYDSSIYDGIAPFGSVQVGLIGDELILTDDTRWYPYEFCNGEAPLHSRAPFPFHPDEYMTWRLGITANQKVQITREDGTIIRFTPEYVDGVLYGFLDGLYAISFGKGFIDPDRSSGPDS